jgi:hypothetical protein
MEIALTLHFIRQSGKFPVTGILDKISRIFQAALLAVPGTYLATKPLVNCDS